MQNFDEDTFKYEHSRWEHYTDKWSAYMNYFENLGIVIAGVSIPFKVFDVGKFLKMRFGPKLKAGSSDSVSGNRSEVKSDFDIYNCFEKSPKETLSTTQVRH